MLTDMMHVVYGGKSVLMGEEVATALLEYAAVLGTANEADVVSVRAVTVAGNETTVAFLLNSNTELTAETATARMTAPPNSEVVAHMRERIATLRNPPPALTEPEEMGPPAYDEI